MAEILGPDGRPIREHESLPITYEFQWAALSTIQKEALLTELSTGIHGQIKEAITERIRTSFDADKFRKMGEKDVFMIQMQLRVPVSLMLRILREFDDAARSQESRVPEGLDGRDEADQTGGQPNHHE